jgi:hypothetical protein
MSSLPYAENSSFAFISPRSAEKGEDHEEELLSQTQNDGKALELHLDTQAGCVY